MPTVSVIIPAFNAEEYIAETLDSVLAQTYRDYEILIIDDGSTDGTRRVLGDYEKQIRIIQKENGGPASARNVGIQHAQGEYLAFLDSDDLWHPEKLQRQVDLLDSSPRIGLVHTARIYFEDDNPTCETLREIAEEDQAEDAFARLFRRNFIGNSTVMARRECFGEVGPFNEAPEFLGTEDYEMWLRIAHRYPVAYIGELLSKYRLRQGQLSSKIEKAYQNEVHVIQQALRIFPDLQKRTDMSVEERLGLLAFEYGRDYFVAGDFSNARQKFSESLSQDYVFSRLPYYLMTFCGGFITALRRLRRSA